MWQRTAIQQVVVGGVARQQTAPGGCRTPLRDLLTFAAIT
jgi:hypothetical protein